MRFAILMIKELGENAGIILLMFVLLAIGWCLVWENANIYGDLTTDYTGIETKFHYSYPFGEIGALLMFVSCISGAVIGVQQFCYPEFTKTWAFLLHRSVRRSTIVLSKFLAFLILHVIFVGGGWGILYWYACKPGLFPLAPPFRIFLQGWYPIWLGFLLYLGVSYTGVSQAKWYTTRLFGALATFVLVLIFAFTVDLYWGILLLVIACIVFGFLVLQMFEVKEF